MQEINSIINDVKNGNNNNVTNDTSVTNDTFYIIQLMVMLGTDRASR